MTRPNPRQERGEHIILAVPSIRALQVPTVSCLFEAYQTGRYEILFQWNEALLPRARARLVYRFMHEYPDSQVMVFIDDDVTWPLACLNEVAQTAVRLDAVVGAPVSLRAPGTVNFLTLPGTPVDLGDNGRTTEVETIGLAMAAVPRTVIEKLIEDPAMKLCKSGEDDPMPFWPLFDRIIEYTDPDWDTWHAEDASFCLRVRYAGMKVYVLPRYQTGHVGEHTFKISAMKGYRSHGR